MYDAFRFLAFLWAILFVYVAYTTTVNNEHLGTAVIRAYEKGNTKKLASLGCVMVDAKDKKEKRSFYTYEVDDGKKHLICRPWKVRT